MVVIITLESDHVTRCTSRLVPSGDKMYSFTFSCEVSEPAVITKNNAYLGLVGVEGIQKVKII